MADYIVKDDGTATGDAGRHVTPQTGSFAALGVANYYSNIGAALAATTSPVGGDRILVSDLHDYTTAAIYELLGPVLGTVYIICVDDANMDAPRTSGNFGSEVCTSASNDLTLRDLTISGMIFGSSDDLQLQGRISMHDFKIAIDGGNDRIRLNQDRSVAILKNGEIAIDDAAGFIAPSDAGTLILEQVSVTTISAGITNLIGGGGATGGGFDLYAKNCDFTSVIGNIMGGIGEAASEDNITAYFELCTLDSGVTLVEEDLEFYDQRLEFRRCSSSSGNAEHKYALLAFGGSTVDDAVIRRAEDPVFADSGAEISYKIVTDNNANRGSPLVLTHPAERYALLSSTDSDEINLHVASTVALTNADIWVEVFYTDGTNKNVGNFATSAPVTIGGGIDFLDSGTALTTDSSSDWRDGAGALTGHNEYIITIPTSGDVGADSEITVKVFIGVPSTIIYMSSIYELT